MTVATAVAGIESISGNRSKSAEAREAITQARSPAALLPRTPIAGQTVTVNVNDFGAIADGRSHRLSTRYATLSEAQAMYPFAGSLEDEIDWCAWMAAALAIYDAPNQVIPGSGNWSAGTIRASGQYVVNRTITLNIVGVRVLGDAVGVTAVGNATSIIWNGAPGTEDAPVYIMDCFTVDEGSGTIVGGNFRKPARATQPGSRTPAGAITGGRPIIERITFLGQGGDMRANSASISRFISGLRLRMASYATVKDCNFGGTLYDGIVCTGPQTCFKPIGCRFDQVHRDAISIRSIFHNFSTTIWIVENEFSFVGRYQLLIDCWGSIEAAPRVINNDFEGAYPESFFIRHPEYWVQGIVAPMCIVNAGNLNWHDNRTEGISLTKGVLGELHLVGCQNPSIKDNTFHKIIFTAGTKSQPRTDSLIKFSNDNHYGDVTDKRNYNCGSSTDFAGENDSISLSNNYNLLEVIVADRIGMAVATPISVDMVGFEIRSFPVKRGSYAKMLDGEALSSTVIPSGVYKMCGTGTALSDLTSQNGDKLQQQLYWGIWGPILAARQGFDNRSELQLFGEMCIRAGNNDGIAPPWSYNGYVGLNINRLMANMTRPANFLGAPLFYANPKDDEGKSLGYYECAEMRDHPVRYMPAPPTTGQWPRRSLVWNTEPAAGAAVGWVCTVGGSPGTWNAFGIIS